MNPTVLRGALLVIVVALATAGLLGVGDTSDDDVFCKLALPLYDVDGGTLTVRDTNGDGPGPCDNDEGMVDYDCSVDYPDGWQGDRPARVDPAVVGGNCGNTGPPVDLGLVGGLGAVAAAAALFVVPLLRHGRTRHDDVRADTAADT
jgi:hypothetical protein